MSVFTIVNGLFKVLDSHARNLFDMVDPCGTCVLLEVNSVIDLIEYSDILHQANVLFELRGVHIVMDSNYLLTPCHTSQQTCKEYSNVASDSIFIRKYTAVCHYSLCFFKHANSGRILH